MQILFLLPLLSVLAFAGWMLYLVRSEQVSMSRFSSRLTELVKKFDSWQMMR
ncbi:hypothetical protein KTO58_06580 [Chitinophaga pendula]|uniref:hypothetical protein n=1 Tax=Chitinophaga TaxID=79328 RepID=UPI0012FD277E|nr:MULTISPECIES: hypothetical protein [Chitinophaga]UCJ08848.1 hypothetical protein KTO58_06580 [Chitinophaga pendula]